MIISSSQHKYVVSRQQVNILSWKLIGYKGQFVTCKTAALVGWSVSIRRGPVPSKPVTGSWLPCVDQSNRLAIVAQIAGSDRKVSECISLHVWLIWHQKEDCHNIMKAVIMFRPIVVYENTQCRSNGWQKSQPACWYWRLDFINLVECERISKSFVNKRLKWIQLWKMKGKQEQNNRTSEWALLRLPSPLLTGVEKSLIELFHKTQSLNRFSRIQKPCVCWSSAICTNSCLCLSYWILMNWDCTKMHKNCFSELLPNCNLFDKSNLHSYTYWHIVGHFL